MMTFEAKPAKPDGRKIRGRHVTVPTEVARLVKVASNYLEIPASEYITNAIKWYTDHIHLFSKMASETESTWLSGEVDKPGDFKRYSKRQAN